MDPTATDSGRRPLHVARQRIATLEAEVERLKAQLAGRFPISADEFTEEHLLAIEAPRIGVWDDRLDGSPLRLSDRAREIYGVPPGTELTYDRLLTMVHPEDRVRLAEAFAAALAQQGAEEFDVQFRLIRPDGEERWIAARGKPHFAGSEDDEKPVRLAGTVIDITEQQRTEIALRQSEERFRRLAEANIVGIVIADQERIWEANDYFLKLVGYRRVLPTGRHLFVAANDPTRIHGKRRSRHRCGPADRHVSSV